MTIIIDTSAEAMRYILNLPLIEDRHKLAQVKAYTRVAADVSNPLHAKIGCDTKTRLKSLVGNAGNGRQAPHIQK